jgi:hypothetical protein
MAATLGDVPLTRWGEFLDEEPFDIDDDHIPF